MTTTTDDDTKGMATISARPKRKASFTSDQARKFAKTAEPGAILTDKNNVGFQLYMNKETPVWRYRYSDPVTGKRHIVVIGTFSWGENSPGLTLPAALAIYDDWVSSDRGPKHERAKKKAAAIAAEEAAQREKAAGKQRTLAGYLAHGYPARLRGKRGEGYATIQRIEAAFPDLLDRDLLTITKMDIYEWQDKREALGRQRATLIRDYGGLKKAVKSAFEDKIIPVNPLADVKLKPPSFEQQKAIHAEGKKDDRRPLTADEMRALFKGLQAFDAEIREGRRNSRKHGKAYLPDLDGVAFAHWFIPFTHLALHTGLRVGDLFSLRWGSELNLTFGNLTKVPEKTLHNANPARIVMPLNTVIRKMMGEWWEQCGKPESGLVFPSERIPGQQLSKTAHNKPWISVKKLGGLPDDLVFYALRHHFASKLIMQGVPVKTVATLLGHKNSMMVESTYAHLIPSHAAGVLEAFAADFVELGKEKKGAGG